MTKRKVMSLITAILFVLLIVFLFLPAVDTYTNNDTMWGALEVYGIIKIFELVFLGAGILVCILQMCGLFKDFTFAYFPAGFGFFYYFLIFSLSLEVDTTSTFTPWFWIGFILYIATTICIFVGSLLSNEKKTLAYSNNQYAPQIIGYDPDTGKPIYR